MNKEIQNLQLIDRIKLNDLIAVKRLGTIEAYHGTVEQLIETVFDVINLDLINISVSFQGVALPNDSPAPTNASFWIATTAGTYNNFGGVVLPPDSLGVIAYTDGQYSISVITFNLDAYVKKVSFDKNSIPSRIGNLIVLDDPDNIIDSAMDAGGVILSGYAGAIVSARMPAVYGRVYWFSGLQGVSAIRFEDKDGNLIGSVLTTANAAIAFTIPANCVFIRTMLKLSGSPQINVVLSQLYYQYNKTKLADKNGIAIVSDDNLNGLSDNMFRVNSPMNIIDHGIDTVGEILEFATGRVSHQIPVKTNNLIDLSNPDNLNNKSLDGAGNIADFADSIVSASLPIDEFKQFMFKGYSVNLGVRFEDAGGNLIGSAVTGGANPYTNTTPAGTKSIRVNLKVQGLAQNPEVYFGSIDGEIKYKLSGFEGGNNRVARFENSNGAKIGFVASNGQNPFVFTPVGGTKFVRFSYTDLDRMVLKPENIRNFDRYPFENKRVMLYGDSITVDYASAFYGAKIKRLTKASVVERYGQSGGAFAASLQSDAFLNPLIASQPDLVIIHSVNSHRGSTPTGYMNSPEGEGSELGGLKKIFNRLISSNKNVKIVFCTPLCYGDVKPLGYPDSFGSTGVNVNGLYLPDYIKGQLELCRMYGVPVVYLTEKCGFRDAVESTVNRVYTLDGVHPNELGYEVMTNLIADVVNYLY